MFQRKSFFLMMILSIFFALLIIGCSSDTTSETDNNSTGETNNTSDTGTKNDEDTVLIGLTVPTYDTADFYGQFMAGVRKGLESSDLNYEIVQRSPADHTAHEQQLAIVEDMLAMDVDYLIMAPTDYEGQRAAYRLVNEANVPLIIGNYSEPFPDEFGATALRYVGYTHADGGKATADYIKENYPEGTKMAIIYGAPGQYSDDRGAKELHLANGMDIIYEHYADWDRSQAFDAVQRLLVAHPEVEVIVAANSFMAMGALEAIASMGQAGEVDVFGAGAILEELEAIEAGRLSGSWFRDPIRIGEAAAEAIILHHQGREDEVEESYNVPIVMIDSVEAIIEHVDPATYEAEGKEFPTLD